MNGILPAVVAGLFLVGLVVERMLLRRHVGAYLRFGLPLGVDVAPVPEVPTGDGQTRLVRWARRGDEVVFWSESGRTGAPLGLHGSVRFRPDGARHRPTFVWAPPWSPLGASVWLGVVGWSRGELMMIPFVVGVAALVLWSYRVFAVKAAEDLRRAWVTIPSPEAP